MGKKITIGLTTEVSEHYYIAIKGVIERVAEIIPGFEFRVVGPYSCGHLPKSKNATEIVQSCFKILGIKKAAVDASKVFEAIKDVIDHQIYDEECLILITGQRLVQEKTQKCYIAHNNVDGIISLADCKNKSQIEATLEVLLIQMLALIGMRIGPCGSDQFCLRKPIPYGKPRAIMDALRKTANATNIGDLFCEECRPYVKEWVNKNPPSTVTYALST